MQPAGSTLPASVSWQPGRTGREGLLLLLLLLLL
jgi:hypothetical protein